MKKFANNLIVQFLMSKQLKSKLIKLSIILALMFATFFCKPICWVLLAVCAIYILFEFSADSILWVMVMGTMTTYAGGACVNTLLIELFAVLIIKLVLDIVKKRIECKKLVIVGPLFAVLTILLMFPFAATYNFAMHLKQLIFFATLILLVIYIKDINIKHLLILFPIAISILCAEYMLFDWFGGDIARAVPQQYSKGVVNRFSIFHKDPNYTGAVLICAIMAWFVAYRVGAIKNYVYFAHLSVLGLFALMTISKATYLIIGVWAAFVAIEKAILCIKTKSFGKMYELLIYLAVLLIVCAIGWKYVDAMYQRIFNPTHTWAASGNEVASLTTGRSDIWIGYFKTIFNSWQISLFGSGVTSGYAVANASAHSMLIEYLYKYGILPILTLLAIFVLILWPHIKQSKLYNWVPMVAIMGIFCSVGSINIKYIYAFMVILACICCNTQNVEDENKV